MQKSRISNDNVMNYLSANQVCELLELSKATLRRKVAMKEIIAIRVNNAMIFRPDDVQAYIDKHKRE